MQKELVVVEALSQHNSCLQCGKQLPKEASEHIGFFFCQSCGFPFLAESKDCFFSIFNQPKNFIIDLDQLENQYYALSKRLHPDRYAAQSNTIRNQIHTYSAQLNHAYTVLKDPESRLQTLLESVGIKPESSQTETSSQLRLDLAETFFDLQERCFEEDENISTDIQRFKAQLESESKLMTTQMYQIASESLWTHKEDALIKKIIALRTQHSYIKSLLNNLQKLGTY